MLSIWIEEWQKIILSYILQQIVWEKLVLEWTGDFFFNQKRKISVIVKTCQLSIRVFVCVISIQRSLLFLIRVSSFFSYFCVNSLYQHIFLKTYNSLHNANFWKPVVIFSFHLYHNFPNVLFPISIRINILEYTCYSPFRLFINSLFNHIIEWELTVEIYNVILVGRD